MLNDIAPFGKMKMVADAEPVPNSQTEKTTSYKTAPLHLVSSQIEMIDLRAAGGFSDDVSYTIGGGRFSSRRRSIQN